jgi:hypothetical protein
LERARTTVSSTAKPAFASLRVNAASDAADQTARMPPGLSAALAAASPDGE